MNKHPKITAEHQRRQAYIYIRQSTLRQVSEHLESQDLQYQLVERAQSLGWEAQQIEIIDEDLGKSGISRQERSGFERLYTDVGLGKVGLILVTNVSRLARNCADWYQLLDLAAWQEVLVSDSEGVYNPTIYADRLLLGIQGAFSEAQWYTMRQQMQAARLNKAQRGELAMRLPIGYERLPNGEVVKVADAQVQQLIDHIFSLFRQEGSVRAVLRQLQQQGLQMARQAKNGVGQPLIVWQQPTYQAVYQVLKLPAYAGAYSYGKRQTTGQPGSGNRKLRWQPRADWLVLIQDAWPGYIGWEEYVTNQETMADNWRATRFAHPERENAGFHTQPFSTNAGGGAAGKGRALLQGLVVCGRCGRPMRVRYRDKPAYVCEATYTQLNQPRCQFFPYAHVDQAVVAAFLQALEPAALEIALTASEQWQQQQQALAQQWQQQLDRASYEVSIAQARYEQVDPQMRLVAAELERAWEEKLQSLAQMTQQWQTIQAEALTELAPDQEAQIRQLATDLPALWSAETTTIPERKRLLRTLIADVTLDSTRQEGVTHLFLRWKTGATTHLTAIRPKPGHPAQHHLVERVRTLAQSETDARIAEILNAEGLVSSWHIKDQPDYVPGQPVSYWTKDRVRNLRNKHHLPTGMPAHSSDGTPRADGLIPAWQAARQLDVSINTLLEWFQHHLIPGQQQRPGTPVWIQLDHTNRHRFDGSLKSPTPEMVLWADAPDHFGLTKSQLSQALLDQKILAWRLPFGRSFRWFMTKNSSISTLSVDLLPL